MNDFQYDTPHSLGEAFSLLEKHGDDARIIAGGTALILFMNQRLVQPGHLLSLQRIPGLDGISATDDGIHIGAMCTHREVETSAVLKSAVPLLCETYHHVATPRIRNMATVGGGLIHADPNLDPTSQPDSPGGAGDPRVSHGPTKGSCGGALPRLLRDRNSTGGNSHPGRNTAPSSQQRHQLHQSSCPGPPTTMLQSQ